MPQTLANAYPSGNGSLSVGDDPFPRRPAAAAWVARLISHWASNEHILGAIFCEAMGEAKHPAAAMYQRLSNNSFMQIEVALAAILSEQPSEDVRLKYEGTIAYMKSIKGRRDRLAHWLYSSFSEEPDAVILIDPKHALEHFFLSRGGNMLPLRKHAFIYGEKEFAEIYSEFQNVTKALHILLEFGRNQDAATLSQLSSMPQIQRAIDKILRGRNAQQEHQEQPDKPLPA